MSSPIQLTDNPLAIGAGQLLSLIPTKNAGERALTTIASGAITEGLGSALGGAAAGATLTSLATGGIVAGALVPVVAAITDILAKRPDWEKRRTAFQSVVNEVLLGNLSTDRAAAEIVGLMEHAKDAGSEANGLLSLARLVGMDRELPRRLPLLPALFAARGFLMEPLGPPLNLEETILEQVLNDPAKNALGQGLRYGPWNQSLPYGPAGLTLGSAIKAGRVTAKNTKLGPVKFGKLTLILPLEAYGAAAPENPIVYTEEARTIETNYAANILGAGQKYPTLFADEYLPILAQAPRSPSSPAPHPGQRMIAAPAPTVTAAFGAPASTAPPTVVPQHPAPGVAVVPFNPEVLPWAHSIPF